MKLEPLFHRLHSGEHNSRVIRIELDEALCDKTVKLGFITPMGKIYVSDALSVTDGVCEYSIPCMLLDARGLLLVQLFVCEDDKFVLKSPVEEYPVYSSVDDMGCPQVSDESLKSLALIFDEVMKKSDIGHIHDERYYTESETDKLLAYKSDSGHNHDNHYYTKKEADGKFRDNSAVCWQDVEDKPGDYKGEKVFLELDDISYEYSYADGSFEGSFSHDVTNCPSDGSMISCEYSLDGVISYSVLHYYNDYSVEDGFALLPDCGNIGYAEFSENGFPDNCFDTAMVLIFYFDGTGKLITKTDLSDYGIKVISSQQEYVKLKNEALDFDNKPYEGSKRLLTSGSVYNALKGFIREVDIPVIPENISAFNNDAGYITEKQNFEGYAKTEDIPTVPENVSEFNNDAGYLTEHQSLEGYAKKEEIIQPLVFEITTSGENVTFKNGKTASQLYEALENNKPVEIRCLIASAPATTYIIITNTNFLKLSTKSASVYQWEVQLLSASTVFLFVLSPDSLMVEKGTVSDFVEEQGTKDGWTYRKWSSGVAECWKTHLERVPANTTDNDVYVSFPFTFASVPFVGCSLLAGGSTNYNTFVIQGGITVSDVRLHFRNNYSGEAVIGAALIVKGRWK